MDSTGSRESTGLGQTEEKTSIHVKELRQCTELKASLYKLPPQLYLQRQMDLS